MQGKDRLEEEFRNEYLNDDLNIDSEDKGFSYEDEAELETGDEYIELPEENETKWWQRKPVIAVGVVVVALALVPVKAMLFSKKPHQTNASSQVIVPTSETITSLDVGTNSNEVQPPVEALVMKQAEMKYTIDEAVAEPPPPSHSDFSVGGNVVAEKEQLEQQQKTTSIDYDRIGEMIASAVKVEFDEAKKPLQSQMIHLSDKLNKISDDHKRMVASVGKLEPAKTKKESRPKVKTEIRNKAVTKNKVGTPQKAVGQEIGDYHLRAIVPGQAWIVSTQDDGRLFTVGLNDTLPGNIQILKIDTAYQVVKTSAGDIKFKGIF
jgi:hypothetical protein